MAKKTLVIGVGSALRSDDGIGVKVIDELKMEGLPGHVSLQSGDISGLDILKYFPSFEKIVIVDAADMKKEPGSIEIFDSNSIKKANFYDKFSTHGIALLETLALAEKLKFGCDITVVGIQPFDTSFKAGLTKSMQEKMPFIIDKVKKEVI